MRIVAAALLAVLVLDIAVPPAAFAMSTSKEIAEGTQLSKEVDRQSLLVDDPFLSTWVNTIGANLAKYRARTDITYRFSIINSDEVNAFALPGGFIHVDMGLLNTVSSDDELAGVMAHEMGHVERRHVVTLGQKNTLLSILIGVLSILSPIAYILGGYGGDLAMNKFSREDELQADQYGLLLMSRAGYDPHSMVDFMDRLRQMDSSPESKTDKWFESHPAAQDRISHLLGYPELDRPSAEQVTAQAVHDEQEGRYSYAQARFAQVLKLHPDDALATQHLAAVQLALKNNGSHTVDRQFAAASGLDSAGREDTAASLQAAASIVRSDTAIAKDQAKYGSQDAESFFTQLQSLSGGVPNLHDPKVEGNNLAMATAGLDQIVRDVNGTLDLTSDAMQTTPSLLADNQSLLRELSDPLRAGAPTPATQAAMRYYPAIAAQLTTSSDELVRAVDRARAAINSGADAIPVLRDYFVVLDSIDTSSGDIAAKDMPRVQAALQKAQDAWDQVKAMALQADDEVYTAQSRWLSARISLFDLTSSPDRYTGFRRALAYRFPGVAVPDYASVLRLGVPPGEISCSAWLAYETKQPVDQILAQAQNTGETCEDMALAKGLLTESMEIAAGLVYQDYIDKPHTL